MLISIGKRQPQPESVVDLLVSCHGKIRHFIEIARVIGAGGVDEPDDISDGCVKVVRYFTLAFPLHVRDEEDSLVPRLVGLDPSLDQALERMRVDHRAHDAEVRGLVAACTDLARSPDDLELRATLGRLATRLSGELFEHLEMEEATLLPAVARWLGPAAESEVIRELRARRAAS
ncbi:MAG TPA: hemerythrin domain-containing protein [Polyangiaceae bacterium]|jgi:hemerythrin-like domain-containing protein|nr:hemerythrin domain-containing protein [Polyangiaceae bacterium]